MCRLILNTILIQYAGIVVPLAEKSLQRAETGMIELTVEELAQMAPASFATSPDIFQRMWRKTRVDILLEEELMDSPTDLLVGQRPESSELKLSSDRRLREFLRKAVSLLTSRPAPDDPAIPTII